MDCAGTSLHRVEQLKHVGDDHDVHLVYFSICFFCFGAFSSLFFFSFLAGLSSSIGHGLGGAKATGSAAEEDDDELCGDVPRAITARFCHEKDPVGTWAHWPATMDLT